VNAQSSIQQFRWPILAVVALCAGIPLGRSLRSSVSAPPPAPSALPSTSAQTPDPNALPKSLDSVSDEAVESEISRLVGASSSLAGTRTPTEVLDAITAANSIKSDLQRFAATYEAVSELGRNDLAEALERARDERYNPIAIRAIERRWAEIDPQGAAKIAAESGGSMKLDDAFFSPFLE